jgi:hypothetical protein
MSAPNRLLSRFQPSCWIGVHVTFTDRERGALVSGVVESTLSGWVTLRLPSGSDIRKRAYDISVSAADAARLPVRTGGRGGIGHSCRSGEARRCSLLRLRWRQFEPRGRRIRTGATG